MKKVNVSRQLEQYYYGNVVDFVDFCNDYYVNLLYIQKYYKDEFNSLSKNFVTIDEHIDMFLTTFKQMLKSVNTEDRYDSLFHKNKSMEKIFQEVYFKFSNLPDFHLMKDYDGVIADLITEKYYEKLKKFSNIIFEQEEIISLTTQKIWNNHIAKSVEEIKTNKYCCLVKVLSDWRKEVKTPALDKYMNSRYAMSVSLVTDYKSRFFSDCQYTQTVGIIYSTEKVLAGNYKDAYLEEFIDGKCPLTHKDYFAVQHTHQDKNHTICSIASKIATPKSVLFMYNALDTYNEVIIDRRKSKPIAIFYVKRESEQNDYNYRRSKETAEKMAKRFNLPLIELESKNLFKDKTENEIDINSL